MKRSILKSLSLIFFVIMVSSCTETYIITPTPSMGFKFDIINNTALKANIRILPVKFGASGYDENIYISKEQYDNFSETTEWLEKENYKEYADGSSVYINTAEYAYINESINAKDQRERVNLKMYYSWEAMLIEIKFESGEISRLTGWPKYFNDKLENVVKYGFFYNVDSDKKICLWREDDNHRDRAYYIFDENGEIISGYNELSLNKYYTVTIEINSADDITVEKGEIEGYEPGEYEEEYEEVTCFCPLAPKEEN